MNSTASPIPGALYQSRASGTPVRLEVMAHEMGPREFHYYIAGADFDDLAPLFASTLTGAQALVIGTSKGPITASELLTAGRTWAGGGTHEKFEWIAYRGTGDSIDAHDDLSAFRLHAPNAVMLFSATGDRQIRMAFSDRGPWRACARATLRGYMMRCSGRTVSPPNDKVCGDFLAHAHRGLTSTPDPDFVSKGTAFEFTAWPGRSPWSTGWIGDPDTGEDRILVYYDRVAGIWAVAS